MRHRFLLVFATPRTADTLHDEVGSRRLIEKRELFSREDSRENKSTYRDKSENKDWEAHSGNSLCDGESGAEANELYEDEVPNSCTSADPQQRARCRRKGAVFGEEDELGGYTVALESLDTHDKEQACKDTVRDEVKNHKKRAGHSAQC